jgi:hypothetical protein
MKVRERKLRGRQHEGSKTNANAFRMQKTYASRVANYETNYGDGTARVRLGKEKLKKGRRKREGPS